MSSDDAKSQVVAEQAAGSTPAPVAGTPLELHRLTVVESKSDDLGQIQPPSGNSDVESNDGLTVSFLSRMRQGPANERRESRIFNLHEQTTPSASTRLELERSEASMK